MTNLKNGLKSHRKYGFYARPDYQINYCNLNVKMFHFYYIALTSLLMLYFVNDSLQIENALSHGITFTIMLFVTFRNVSNGTSWFWLIIPHYLI